MSCPLCNSNNIQIIFSESDVPVFQNKVYLSREEAKNATCGEMSLSFCHHCGFIWNDVFDPSLLDYDENYQNEQGLSTIFQTHLDQVCNIIGEHIPIGSKTVEIGCGKGKFLLMLDARGYQVQGYDPAYEGDDIRIVTSYYPPDTKDSTDRKPANMIILRHVLEHIQNPMHFLKVIASANEYKGLLYIEVPDFKWILKHNAFFDVFYEHCNYFSLSVLQDIFPNAVDSGSLFGEQYCYIIINLEDLKHDIQYTFAQNETQQPMFFVSVNKWRTFVQNNPDCLIWGAGAKGATFLRQVDPESKYVLGCIDINPVKQERFISKTGHKIISPEYLNKMHPSGLIIMNGNYVKEICELMQNREKIPIYVLGEESICKY